jgi:TRAP-type mannitol/chloroaromatic compound transport system permease small subunit
MRPLLALIDGLARVLLWVAGMGLVVLIGTTLYEVAARYVFGAPTIWAFDVANLINGALFLLAAAWAVRIDGHVRIDVFSRKLPQRFQDVVQILFLLLLFLPALGFLIHAAWGQTARAFLTDDRVLSAWRPLIWPFYLPIALGLTALALSCLAEILRRGARLAGREVESTPGGATPA